MRAIAITEFGGRDKLRLLDLPVPEPQAGEILIHVKAAGVNPVDWKIREGRLQGRLPHRFPLILGWDAAGIVERIAGAAAGFSVGDAVYAYCRKPVIQGGAYAEYVAVPAASAALKPQIMSFPEAATVPLAGLTAYQSLFDAARLRPGEAVLIHAAAGGVGGFAAQLAKDRGALVLGTAQAAKHAYLRQLGVTEPIDYTRGDFRDAVRRTHKSGVDVIFDTIGGETLTRSAELLKPGGRLVSLIDPQGVEQLKLAGLQAFYVFVEPRQAQLRELALLIDAGRLRTFIAAAFPLAEAAKAHALSESQRVAGKIVLTL